MTRFLLLSILLVFGCAHPPPIGEATRSAFAAQAQAGSSPNAPSQLSTEEVRSIVGTGEAAGRSRTQPRKASSSRGSTKEPLNNDSSSGQP